MHEDQNSFRLVQAERVHRPYDDGAVLDIDDEFHRGLPLISDRKFDGLVDVPLQETGA